MPESNPHFIEGERQILATLIWGNGEVNVSAVMGSLEQEDFYSEKRRKIFSAACSLWERREQIDEATVAFELQKMDVANPKGFLLEHLGEASVNCSLIDPNIQKLHECSRRRKMMGLFAASAGKLRNLSEDVDEVLQGVKRGMAVDAGIDEAQPTVLRDTLVEISKDYGKSNEGSVKCGFPTVDAELGGFLPGELVLIVGSPGTGKTWMLLSMLAHIIRKGNSALMLSGEIGAKEWLTKLGCHMGGVNYRKYRTAAFQDEDFTKFISALRELGNLNLSPADKREAPTLGRIHARAARFKYDVVCIDAAYLFRPRGDLDGWEYWRHISLELKNIALECQTVVLATTQVGRQKQISYSNGFQEDASLILKIEGERLQGGTEVKALKARDSHPFTLQLSVNFEHSRIGELAHERTNGTDGPVPF